MWWPHFFPRESPGRTLAGGLTSSREQESRRCGSRASSPHVRFFTISGLQQEATRCKHTFSSANLSLSCPGIRSALWARIPSTHIVKQRGVRALKATLLALSWLLRSFSENIRTASRSLRELV